MSAIKLRNGERFDPREFPQRLMDNLNARLNGLASEADEEPEEDAS